MDIDLRRLLVKIARLYYEEDLTQAEISVRLRMSRQKVQRILSQSREQGIVQFAIAPIFGIFSDLEKALEARFGLTEALGVEAADSHLFGLDGGEGKGVDAGLRRHDGEINGLVTVRSTASSW